MSFSRGARDVETELDKNFLTLKYTQLEIGNIAMRYIMGYQ